MIQASGDDPPIAEITVISMVAVGRASPLGSEKSYAQIFYY